MGQTLLFTNHFPSDEYYFFEHYAQVLINL